MTSPNIELNNVPSAIPTTVRHIEPEEFVRYMKAVREIGGQHGDPNAVDYSEAAIVLANLFIKLRDYKCPDCERNDDSVESLNEQLDQQRAVIEDLEQQIEELKSQQQTDESGT